MTSASDAKKQLQLEVGGSLFELIEFTLERKVDGKTVRGKYGVNVAKVREVVRMPKINPLASRVAGLAGVFELRGVPIPAVNLATVLGDDSAEPRPSQQVIVTEFSQKRAGFIVDQTHRIRRIAWDKVLPPSADAGSFMSGMTLVDDSEFLFILDLERILLTLEFKSAGGAHGLPPGMGMSGMAMPQQAYMPQAPQMQPVQQQAPVQRGNVGGLVGNGTSVLIVEDSSVIRNGLRDALSRAGFRVTEASDGVEAWGMLERMANNAHDPFALVVTDVEMPRMDGLSLTKKIRDHASLAELPVLLHTSLSGRANQQAGMTVGANGYVIKNDYRTLFELIKEILGTSGVSVA